MPVIPHQALRLHSQLSAADAMLALKAQVAPPRPPFSLSIAFGSLPFEGTLDGARFELQRVIQYRNSFLPQIRGTIEPATAGCTVSLTMSLHPLVIAFAIIWLMVVSAGACVAVAAALGQSRVQAGTFIPFGMLLFFGILVSASFHFEARKAERLLREILVAPANGGALRGAAREP
jgi:hypothetical protein